MNEVVSRRAREALDALLIRISDPIARRLGLYWKSKSTSDRLPSRTDIDPIEIPDLLRYLMLLDVARESGRARFRVRLLGTQVIEWAGRDTTGLYLDSLDYSGHGIDVTEDYRVVAESGLPRYDERYARWPDREHKFFRRLMLPLAADGSIVDMIVGVLQVVAPPRQVDPRPRRSGF